ncbi:TIM-barrel domain-containing protein [Clostridium beijerinckii]|uniref:glycoside hydrolase family 31 protein n=1 Tax=Clostridium beijerinckii TaxID=1520 RepID=UPI0030FEF710|nr:alpha-D-xyloside xylohydrolase [Clostridium beijerinckii]
MEETQDSIILRTGLITLTINKKTGQFVWKNGKNNEILLQERDKELVSIPVEKYSTNGEKAIIKRVKTVDGERSFVENLKPYIDTMAYRAKLSFEWQEKEAIHGLGQGEEGIYNYRGNSQYLYQHNMRTPFPCLVSNKNYGILFDCGSLMTLNDDSRGAYVYLDVVEQLDYYFVFGEKLDDIVGGFRKITGRAAMLPKWALGYIQSKETYRNQEELVEVVKEYRKRNVPIDCIVQDWHTWEEGLWGNKRLDKNRYPDIGKANKEIHDLNAHTMVSIWPNMNVGGEDYEEFLQAEYLLGDNSTYDAFNEDARKMYWEQAEKELYKGGFDAWWCDSTEPFSGPDWNGEKIREPWERFMLVGNEHKKFLDPAKANLFALMHEKGIFENQRKVSPDKRVLNLARSGYIGSQKYGVVLWSGDTNATWGTFRKQITEGLNLCLSGLPYWTLDIGAFFTVGSEWRNRGCGCNNNPNPLWFWQGDYNEGVNDSAYRELYVRWLQYGAFLPMFRSHGTDTPREIWNFGENGEMFYDAIEKFINLRYSLIPYFYSLAGKVTQNHYTMLRSLLFDFSNDEIATEISDEFMCGDSILVCPVTNPMYYEPNSKSIDEPKIRKCYLPKGADWYDFWTKERLSGGSYVVADALIDKIPLFIRVGSIIPMEEGLQYAEQVSDKPFQIHIYPGDDCEFEFYEDSGDGYEYEKGIYNKILMKWEDKESKFTIGKADYDFQQSIKNRSCTIFVNDKSIDFIYRGEPLTFLIK